MEANQPQRRVALKTVENVREELQKVYREARNGKILSADLGRFANCLQIIARVIEGGELEARLNKLEEAAQK